ncbi:hypothetical protein [Micromonospora sp. NPDC023956]|uniref:hypothetical protein n=1 Tax=Micromonospora sp. NPDC023956 TaxID=3155722 RepID=UPI0033CC400B
MSLATCRKGLAMALTTAILLPLTGCGPGEGAVRTGWLAPSSPARSTPGTRVPAPVTGACRLVETATVRALLELPAVRKKERRPVDAVPGVRTYTCELLADGEPVLTVRVAVGPASGSASANVRAALDDRPGEPVDGLGDAAAYDRYGDTGTVAAAFRSGARMRVLLVSARRGGRAELVEVARTVARRL